MYKELATIKYGEEVTGFVVYDGYETKVIDKEYAKEIAAKMDMDTLTYKDGQFIPIIQGKLANDLKKKLLWKSANKHVRAATFEDYVNNDCIFQKQAIELMKTTYKIALANICLAFGVPVRNTVNWFLTIAFYSDPKTADQIKNALLVYEPHIKSIQKMHDYGGFMMLNLPLYDAKCGFDLFTFQQKTGIQFLYNIDMIETIQERTQYIVNYYPYFIRKIMEKLIPSKESLKQLSDKIEEVNTQTIITSLRRRNI